MDSAIIQVHVFITYLSLNYFATFCITYKFIRSRHPFELHVLFSPSPLFLSETFQTSRSILPEHWLIMWLINWLIRWLITWLNHDTGAPGRLRLCATASSTRLIFDKDRNHVVHTMGHIVNHLIDLQVNVNCPLVVISCDIFDHFSNTWILRLFPTEYLSMSFLKF